MRRALRLLNLRRLASISLRTVIAVVAVAAGSSLALSVFIVDGSASYSLNRLSGQIGGASALRVVGATSTAGIDFHALAAVTRTPGVQSVLPVIEAITVVRTTHDRNEGVLALGLNCNSLALVARADCAAGGTGATSSGGPIYLSASLHRQLSSSSWLETNLGLDHLSHVVPLRSLDAVDRGDVVVLPLAEAQRQFTRGNRVDDVYVTPAPGVPIAVLQNRLARAVGPWDGVVNATTPPAQISLALEAFTPILTLLAILAAGIAVVLVYNVIALSMEERRREQAIVAAIGAPPALLLVGPFLEAGVLGAVGGILGALGGLLLAGPIISTLSSVTEQLAGISITEHASTGTFVAGLVIGIVIGLVAAVRPVRRSLRADIAAEIAQREQRAEGSTTASLGWASAYTLLAAGGVALCWAGNRNGSLQQWQPTAALIGFVLAMLFSILALGVWAPLVVRAFARSGRPRGGVGRLGVTNLIREPGRTGVMAVAIAATVVVAFITSSYSDAIDHDIANGFHSSSRADSVLVTTAASANEANADGQIPPATIAALGRLPGVAGIDGLYGELTGHSTGGLTFVESETDPSLRGGVVYAGTANPVAFAAGGVLVGANLARRDHVGTGSTLTLDTPSGLARVRVQGVWNNGDAAGDNVYIPLSLQDRIFGSGSPSEVALLVDHRASAARVEVEAQAAHLGPYLKYSTPTQQLSKDDSNATSQLTPFLVLQRALLLVAFISVLSTLVLAGLQRRREFGLLGAVGMTPGELARMVLAEALTVSVVAVLLGVVVGFLLLAVLLDVSPLLVGYHDSFAPAFSSLFIYGPIAIAVSLLASLWPSRQAGRTPILEAVKYE